MMKLPGEASARKRKNPVCDYAISCCCTIRANSSWKKGNSDMFEWIPALIVAATALNGILAGASLDQSIKQLPARHRIGATAYSVYSRASDLGNCVVWYALLGIGAALITIIAALVVLFQGVSSAYTLPLYIAAILSALHSLATTQA